MSVADERRAQSHERAAFIDFFGLFGSLMEVENGAKWYTRSVEEEEKWWSRWLLTGPVFEGPFSSSSTAGCRLRRPLISSRSDHPGLSSIFAVATTGLNTITSMYTKWHAQEVFCYVRAIENFAPLEAKKQIIFRPSHMCSKWPASLNMLLLEGKYAGRSP